MALHIGDAARPTDKVWVPRYDDGKVEDRLKVRGEHVNRVAEGPGEGININKQLVQVYTPHLMFIGPCEHGKARVVQEEKCIVRLDYLVLEMRWRGTGTKRLMEPERAPTEGAKPQYTNSTQIRSISRRKSLLARHSPRRPSKRERRSTSRGLQAFPGHRSGNVSVHHRWRGSAGEHKNAQVYIII